MPAELQQQAEVIADGAVAGDLAVGDGEDVDLFVGDRPTGGCDAVERSDVLARHGRGGHHRVALRDGLLEFETQVRERVA